MGIANVFSRNGGDANARLASTPTRYSKDAFLAPTGEDESPWQAVIRQFDETGPGFVGATLDTKAMLVSMIDVDVTTLKGESIEEEYDSAYLPATVAAIPFYLGLEGSLYRAARLYESVGEYWNVPTDKGWVVAATPELCKADAKGMPSEQKRDGRTIGKWTYVKLRAKSNKKNMFLYDEKGNMIYDERGRPEVDHNFALRITGTPKRHNIPASVFLGDPTSPMRRAITFLSLYMSVLSHLQNDRESMAQWAKFVYFGKDDGAWKTVDELKKRGLPPAIADFLELGKMDGRTTKFFPIMNEAPPQLVDLAAPIDPQMVPLFQYLQRSFYDSMNMPTRSLADDPSNHWGDYLEWDKLVQLSVTPSAHKVLDDFTEDIWRPAIQRVIANNDKLPEDQQIPLKVIPSQIKLWPNTQKIERSMANIPEIIKLWENGFISDEYARMMIKVPEWAKPDLPDGITMDTIREQVLTRRGRNEKGTSNVEEPQMASITMETVKNFRGSRNLVSEKLNRVELEAWANAQGILDTQLASVLDHLGRKIIRTFSDAKTASAKTELEKLKLVDIKEVVFQADRGVVAAQGTDLEEATNNHKAEITAAIIAMFMLLGYKRDDAVGGQISTPEEYLAVITAAGGLAAHNLVRFALSDLARRGYSEDRNIKVPAYIIRDVLSAAGGASVVDNVLIRDRDGLIKKNNRQYIGGYATGPDVQDILKRGTSWMEPQVIMWEWWHDHPKNPFDPHVALNGENYTLASRSDMLQNVDNFPRSGMYYPGDHQGCLCQELIVTIPYSEYQREYGNG